MLDVLYRSIERGVRDGRVFGGSFLSFDLLPTVQTHKTRRHFTLFLLVCRRKVANCRWGEGLHVGYVEERNLFILHRHSLRHLNSGTVNKISIIKGRNRLVCAFLWLADALKAFN